MIPLTFGPGNLQLGDTQVVCGIIYDDTQILTLASSSKALGYDGRSISWLHDFIFHLSRFVPVSMDVLEELSEPDSIDLRGQSVPVIPTTIFLSACHIILAANEAGYLYASELKYAKRARSIMDQLNDVSIAEKITDASGFTTFKEAAKLSIGTLIDQMGIKVGHWVPTLPEAYFTGIMDVKGWKWAGIRANLAEFATICSDTVFARLPSENLEKLIDQKPRKRYRKGDRPAAYVPDENLQEAAVKIMTLMEATNYDWNSFSLLLSRQLPIITPDMSLPATQRSSTDQARLNFFRENLGKALSSGKFR